MQEYPQHFVPFINPPGNDPPLSTVTSGELSSLLSVHPNLFQGYGEITLPNEMPADHEIFGDYNLNLTVPPHCRIIRPPRQRIPGYSGPDGRG